VWGDGVDAALAALPATYATGGEVRSRGLPNGTDQTTLVQAELDALIAGGGGTLLLPTSPFGNVPVKVTTLTLANDGATPPTQPPITIKGTGAFFSGRGTPPSGGSILEFTGTDTYGLLKTNGLGVLRIEGVMFRNTGAGTTPFIYTTNTTLHVEHCSFLGSKSGVTCDQDAIICGGVNQVEGFAGWTDGFQGYGTKIADNFFDRIRRAVYGRAFFNGAVIRDNTIWQSCGSNLAGGAAIEIDGQPGTGSQAAVGNVIAGNLIETWSYIYAIKLRWSQQNSIAENNAYDSGAAFVAVVRCEVGGQYNNISDGYYDGTKAGLSEDASVLHYNTRITAQQSVPSRFSEGLTVMKAFGLGADQAATASHTLTVSGAEVYHLHNGTDCGFRWYGTGMAIGGADRSASALSVVPATDTRPGLTVKRNTSGSTADLVQVMSETEALLTRVNKAGLIITKVATAPVLADLVDGEIALYTDGAGALKVAQRVSGVLTIKTATLT